MILLRAPLPLQKMQRITAKNKKLNFMVMIWDLEMDASHSGDSDPQGDH